MENLHRSEFFCTAGVVIQNRDQPKTNQRNLAAWFLKTGNYNSSSDLKNYLSSSGPRDSGNKGSSLVGGRPLLAKEATSVRMRWPTTNDERPTTASSQIHDQQLRFSHESEMKQAFAA